MPTNSWLSGLSPTPGSLETPAAAGMIEGTVTFAHPSGFLAVVDGDVDDCLYVIQACCLV